MKCNIRLFCAPFPVVISEGFSRAQRKDTAHFKVTLSCMKLFPYPAPLLFCFSQTHSKSITTLSLKKSNKINTNTRFWSFVVSSASTVFHEFVLKKRDLDQFCSPVCLPAIQTPRSFLESVRFVRPGSPPTSPALWKHERFQI